MINLFEYQNKVDLPASLSLEGLETFLDDIWNKREKSAYYNTNTDGRIESQRFLQFLYKSKQIKSNKYIGVIHFENHKINLLPKIFFKENKQYLDNEISQIHNHILWWLSYCRKLKFPKYQTSLGSTKSDFFEILIYLFSKYTRKLLNNSIFQQYQEINKELSFVKGRINTNAYINENLGKARWHKVNCTYDAFVLDNEFNRIVKHVTKLLFNVTTIKENKKYLREILFILDDVSDVNATAQQCAKISFNPIFEAFETVRDYCQLFLSNCVSFNYKNELKLFAFLLPMEYVFEDFVFGFIDKELKQINAESQKGGIYLTKDKTFQLKPDLLLTYNNKSIIADAKYKIINRNSDDNKKGISQSDLYQVIAYAIRFEVSKIILLYPSTINQNQLQETTSTIVDELTIIDKLANGKAIKVSVHQIPILDENLVEQSINPKVELSALFENLGNTLKKTLFDIISLETLQRFKKSKQYE